MVGVYLFTDYNFFSHLSAKYQNVFQWLWDDGKHLDKLATAGSNQVKRAFEKSYRDREKAQEARSITSAKQPMDDLLNIAKNNRKTAVKYYFNCGFCMFLHESYSKYCTREKHRCPLLSCNDTNVKKLAMKALTLALWCNNISPVRK